MESFITKDGKKLRRGYTTGSCAAAAAKSAALMLLTGRRLDSVSLVTPNGTALDLTVHGTVISDGCVICGIVKDSGDDPDVTNGITIYAKVEKTNERGVKIDGGEGIGRVTKPGLDQPVGAAAINSTPRKMIEEELYAVCEDCGYGGGLSVLIFAPEGADIAKKTFNPRLGIEGGISILGTTGTVEPMSDSAVVETIRAELSIRAALGKTSVLFTPGNYGEEFIKNELNISQNTAVTTSNFIGEAFSAAAEMGFQNAILVGHIGKLIKLAGGIFNTHSKYGDCRAEIFAAHAALCGAPREDISVVMNSATTDDMLDILDRSGLCGAVMESVSDKIAYQLENRRLGAMKTAVISFSKVYGVLSETENAEQILELIKKEY